MPTRNNLRLARALFRRKITIYYLQLRTGSTLINCVRVVDSGEKFNNISGLPKLFWSRAASLVWGIGQRVEITKFLNVLC